MVAVRYAREASPRAETPAEKDYTELFTGDRHGRGHLRQQRVCGQGAYRLIERPHLVLNMEEPSPQIKVTPYQRVLKESLENMQ
jgi:hypothetical protein